MNTKTEASVTFRMSGGSALVTLENPPVNAIDATARRALFEAAARAENEGADRVVLSGAERMFSAGADTREFDQPVAPPTLPAVFDRIEASPVPWIAAVHGITFGGACELMLACRYRIAAPDVSIGLPEVKLGLVPGAGGTQRLPRLIGPAEAMKMICSGEPVDSGQALQIGLIEDVAENPVEAALNANIADLRHTARVCDRKCAPAAPGEFEKARTDIDPKAPASPAALRAIDLIEATCHLPIRDGLDAEEKLFFELRDSAESIALREAFFASRKPGR